MRRIAGLVLTAVAAIGAGVVAIPAGAASPTSHWTADRLAAAVPRDLVLDARGLAYLRAPDGALDPHGHGTPQLYARRSPASPAAAPGGGGSSDVTGPTVAGLDPAAGAEIGASHTFSATVSDASGVRAVSFVVVYPGGTRTQSFAASTSGGGVYTVALSGFTDGTWSWYVVATDGSRNRNKTTTPSSAFTVSTTGGGGGGFDGVANDAWSGGAVQLASGRVYFEMPTNKRLTRWQGYVCSGTAISDGTGGRSLVLTAAHCVYDDVNKAFARNVLFIPNQDASSARTDTNCDNDPIGCWLPSHGVVDASWATATFPANVEWDYGVYVVPDVGAHRGAAASSDVLDAAVEPLGVDGSTTTGSVTDAIGYSYSDDPNLMYCEEAIAEQGNGVDWWLAHCGLSGGASGGPWMAASSAGAGPVLSVNSWGYTDRPGMAGPHLATASFDCVVATARSVGANDATC